MTTPARPRVLVVTGDTLGERMAGPAIRAWEMAGALSAVGEVVLGAVGGCTLEGDGFLARSIDDAGLRALAHWCDVLVFQGFLLRDFPWLAATDTVLVADLYDPVHLEVLEQEREATPAEREARSADSAATIEQQVRRADFFLCASPRQRDFWIGHLAALGRINPRTYDRDPSLDSLIAIVPFGTQDVPAVASRPALRGVVPGIDHGDVVLLWGGGIYNWFDPLTLIRAVDVLRVAHPALRLYFLGTRHPNPAVPAMRMAAAAQELAAGLGLLGRHVFFHADWVAYDDRAGYLLEADIGVSCHLEHIETRYSFRTRILDYLWAGLPIVTTAGDGFGDLVAAEGLGAAVPAGDVPALVAALDPLVGSAAARAACRERVAAVAPAFAWSAALAPLVAFCRAPRPAADRPVGGFGAFSPPAPPGLPARLRAALAEAGVRGTAQRVVARLRTARRT